MSVMRHATLAAVCLLLSSVCVLGLSPEAGVVASPETSHESQYFFSDEADAPQLQLLQQQDQAMMMPPPEDRGLLAQSGSDAAAALEEQAAWLEANAETRAMFESDDSLKEQATAASHAELAAQQSPADALLEREAMVGGNDAETMAQTSVLREEDFAPNDIERAQQAFLESDAAAEQRVEQQIAAQVAAHEAAEVHAQQAQKAEEEAFLERETAQGHARVALAAAQSADFGNDVMLESASQTGSDSESEHESAASSQVYDGLDAEHIMEAELDAEMDAENAALARQQTEGKAFAVSEAATHSEAGAAFATQTQTDALSAVPRALSEVHSQVQQPRAESAAEADADEGYVQAVMAAQKAKEAKMAQQAMAEIEDYPAMIESASTSRSIPHAVAHAADHARRAVSNAASHVRGAFGKLRGHINDAVSRVSGRSQQDRHSAHSFLASRAHARAQGRARGRARAGHGHGHGHGHGAKGGDQWWLEKAPWFLPPPPEWGPMPVTMYTSYYHKPHHPAHMDYAHGIPLPHAEALDLARRTYPQPPFDMQANGGSSFMEVSSQSHATATVDAEANAEALANLQELAELDSEEKELAELHEQQSQMEQEDLADEQTMLLEVNSAGQAAGHSQAEATAHSGSESEMEVSTGSQAGGVFFLDADAGKPDDQDMSHAVEAVEVDDLARASPIKDDIVFVQHM